MQWNGKLGITLGWLCLGALTAVAHPYTLRGKVFNTQGKPLPATTIVLSADSAGYKERVYATTSPEEAFSLQASQVKDSLTLTTLPHEQVLDEGVMRDNSPEIFFQEEKVVYTPEVFRTGTEENLEQVLNKLPGITIDTDGFVSYQGRRISKILVNGEDMLPSSQASTLSTLSADFAQEIEVLTDYEDENGEQALHEKKPIALNVKSKKPVKVNGWIEGAGGVMNHYRAQTSLITLTPKVAVGVQAHANNTGVPLLTSGDLKHWHTQYDRLGSAQTTFYNAAEATLLFPQEDEHKRQGEMGNVSLLWRPTSHYSLETNTLFSHLITEAHDASLESYKPPQEAAPAHHEMHTQRQKTTCYITQRVHQRWQPSSKFSFDMKTRFDYDILGRLHTMQYTQRDTTPHAIDQQGKTHNLLFDNGLELKWVLGRGVLFIGNDFYYNQNRQQHAYSSNAWLLPVPYVPAWRENTASHFMDWQTLQKSYTIHSYVGFMHPVGNTLLLRGEVLHTMPHIYSLYTRGDSIHSPEQLTHQHVEGALSLIKNKGLFVCNIVGRGGWKYTQQLTNGNPDRWRYWTLDPMVQLGLHFSKSHNLLTTTTYEMKHLPLFPMSRNWYMLNYKGMKAPSLVNTPYSKNVMVKLEHSYSSDKPHLFLYSQAVYTHSLSAPLMEITHHGHAYACHFRDGGKGYNIDVYSSLSVGLGNWPIDLKMKGSYTQSEKSVAHHGNTWPLLARNVNGTLSLHSRFTTSPVNVSIGGSAGWLYQAMEELPLRCNLYEYSGTLALLFAMKGFSATLNGYIQHAMNTYDKYLFYDFGFQMRYTYKNWLFALLGTDILHLKKSEWRKEILNPEYHATVRYGRMPGNIMLSLRYTF